MGKEDPSAELKASDLLAAIRRRGRRGLTVQQLVNQLAAERKIGRSEARRLLRPALKTLQRDGRVVLGRGKRYFVPEASGIETSSVTRSGFSRRATSIPSRPFVAETVSYPLSCRSISR